MIKNFFLVVSSITALALLASAQKPESFEQAKQLSTRLNKPILLEFVHED